MCHVSADSRGSSSEVLWCILSLVKKTLYCRRAGFEPQLNRRSGRGWRSLTLCYSLNFWWCWRALLAAIAFLGIVSLCRPPPHQHWGRARAAGNRFTRDDKEPGPQLGAKQLPEERPRESAETRHTSPLPSRHVRRKGTAPLSGAEEQTARALRAYAICACLLSLQMRSIY